MGPHEGRVAPRRIREIPAFSKALLCWAQLALCIFSLLLKLKIESRNYEGSFSQEYFVYCKKKLRNQGGNYPQDADDDLISVYLNVVPLHAYYSPQELLFSSANFSCSSSNLSLQFLSYLVKYNMIRYLSIYALAMNSYSTRLFSFLVCTLTLNGQTLRIFSLLLAGG